MIYILFILFLIAKNDRDCSRYNYRASVTFHVLRFFGLWTSKRAAWFISNTSSTDSWLIHNPLSFLANGWKFFEMVSVLSFCTMTVLYFSTLYNIPVWGLIALDVSLYTLLGGFHSALDGSLFRK